MAELRDLDTARLLVLQGLWLQRLHKPLARSVRPALEWLLELAGTGQGVPPSGFVADLGQSMFSVPTGRLETAGDVPGLPAGLLRGYEDYMLGKLFGDPSWERAANALRPCPGRERARGLAFVLQQFQARAGITVVQLNPAVLKTLLREPPEQLLRDGWNSLLRDGILPLLVEMYESLIAAARRLADLLAAEDLFELEHGIALAEFGQRMALRQVLQTAELLEKALPAYRPRPLRGRQEIPTRLLEEDTYPVGGFVSLSTRGSMESLLQSQLAYMEGSERPDLFDIKYLRDELLYYSRDENQFLRRRRTYVFVLAPDLIQARCKDADLPYQRIILALALLLVLIRRLTDWLSADALLFRLVFLLDKKTESLAPERELLHMLLREQRENGTVVLEAAPAPQAVARECVLLSRRSQCHVLTVAMRSPPFPAEDTQISHLSLAASQPRLAIEGLDLSVSEPETGWPAWQHCLETLLQLWI